MKIPEGVQVYAVGGWVRDRLLGLEVKDHDFVVVGATPEQMLNLGFTPVGADFPVFLHPLTNDQFALARTERKVGTGYVGFETDANPSVTLEEDLARRDLTINSMARRVLDFNDLGHAKLDDNIIDPFNGQVDLANHTLRHTTTAFAEDPLRVLRVARFRARYQFIIHGDTWKLMKSLVDELSTLTPERVWQELDGAMAEKSPELFFDTIFNIGAERILFPELPKHRFIRTLRHIKQTNSRYCVLFSHTPDVVASVLFDRLKTPTDIRSTVRKYEHVLDNSDWSSNGIVHLLSKIDAYRNHNAMLAIIEALRWFPGSKATTLQLAWTAAKSVKFQDLSEIDQRTLKGIEIHNHLNSLRVEAVMEALTPEF